MGIIYNCYLFFWRIITQQVLMRIKKRHNGIADCSAEHKEQFSKVKEVAAHVTNIRRNKENSLRPVNISPTQTKSLSQMILNLKRSA